MKQRGVNLHVIFLEKLPPLVGQGAVDGNKHSVAIFTYPTLIPGELNFNPAGCGIVQSRLCMQKNGANISPEKARDSVRKGARAAGRSAQKAAPGKSLITT